MPNKEQLRELVETYVTAVGDRDLDRVVGLFAADAVQEDPVGSPPNVGAEAIRGFFEKAFAGTFSTTLTGPVLVADEHNVAFHFTIEVPTGGDPFVVRVIDAVRVDDDGRIAELRAYVD